MRRGIWALIVVFLCWSASLDTAYSIRWLALRKAVGLHWNSTNAVSAVCRKARLHFGLVRRQAKICRTSAEVMPHIVKAATQTVLTCQSIFADRRWNCSSIETAPSFTPDLNSGTREQAYVYALSSAAVVWTVSRACSAGALFHCSCSPPPRDPPNGNFKWGGCGDNVRWGIQFGKQFTDSAEKRAAASRSKITHNSHRQLTTPKQQERQKRVRRKKKGDEGNLVLQTVPATTTFPAYYGRGRLKSSLAAVNLHNNRAGRKAVESSLVTQCKCHGVSGSCNIKTCWRALPSLHEIGERLKRKFAIATEVVSRRVGAGRKLLPARAAIGLFSEEDLIYVTKSPDYCLRDTRVGSYGTAGRTCNASSQGYDSCEDMCCGRGYHTVSVEKVERCHCKYYWCCYVQCKVCRSWVEKNVCN